MPLYELIPGATPQQWSLDVATGLTVGPGDRRFLFGGVGLAAGIDTLQRATGRPAICATAQFVSFARIGELLDLSVEVLAGGNAITQAQVMARVGDRHVLTVVAALGSRDGAHDGQWLRAPEVPQPEDCPSAPGPRLTDALHSRFEVRVAEGRYGWSQSEAGAGQERLLFWVRSREGFEVDAALLAVIADFVAVGIGPTIGLRAGGNSLDNTIRFVAGAQAGEWVLCDARIESIGAGIVHGTMHMFAPAGALLATASQSMILRVHPPQTSPKP